MTTAEALKAHRATFWQARDCNAWMAKEAQLLAQLAREAGAPDYVVRDHSDYARSIMGILETRDQYYA